MSDEISIVVSAQDNFSSVLGNFGNIMTGVKSTIDLVAGAFNTVKDFTSQFINAAADSQVVVTQLNTTLAATGNTVGLSSQQLQDLATSMMNMSGYSDEAEMSAETMLLRFENLNGIFPQALEITNNLARAIGMDLTTAAQTVGKALDDPEAGIGRLNTAFKLFNATEMENIKTMAANGDIAGAQAEIMARLQQKVGDAAQAYGTTFTGQLSIASEKLDNLKELIGGAFLPVLTSLISKFNEMADSPQVIQFFTDLSGAISQALTGDLSGIDNFVGRLFENIATGIDTWLMGNGPQQLSDKVISFIDNVGTGGTTSSRALNAMSRVFSALLTALGQIDWGAIGNAIDTKLADAISSHDWTSAGDDFGKAIAAALSGGIQTGMDGEKSQAIPAIGKAISDWFLAASGVANWTEFKNTFIGIIQQFVLQPIAAWIHDNWWRIILPMVPTLSNAQKQYIENSITGIVDSIQQGFTNGLNAMGLTGWVDWWTTHVIAPVKKLLGIASPSTLFFDIGKDIILGLINGIASMINAIEAKIMEVARTVLGPLQPILDMLGIHIDLGATTTDQTGTTGGRDMGGLSTPSTPTTTTPTSPTNGGTATYNFYGPVYMSNVPAEGQYDCLPNPVIQSGSNQLVFHGY